MEERRLILFFLLLFSSSFLFLYGGSGPYPSCSLIREWLGPRMLAAPIRVFLLFLIGFRFSTIVLREAIHV